MKGFYGPHLIVDLFGCDKDALQDEELIRKYLITAIELAGMTLIHGPHVIKYDAPKPLDSGVTGIAVLAESHITIHSYPNREGYCTLDLYSCKAFDTDLILAYIDSTFSPATMKSSIKWRGEGFPN